MCSVESYCYALVSSSPVSKLACGFHAENAGLLALCPPSGVKATNPKQLARFFTEWFMQEIAALHDPAQVLLTAADKAGADAADVLISYSEGLDLRNHQGEVDQVNSLQGTLSSGLGVLVGSRQALVSGSDLRRETLETMAEAAVARAKKVPENEWLGLPDPEPSLTDDLDLLDPNPPSQDWLVEQVNAMHDIVMGHDAISGTEGSSAGLYRQQMILANSKGFSPKKKAAGYP